MWAWPGVRVVMLALYLLLEFLQLSRHIATRVVVVRVKPGTGGVRGHGGYKVRGVAWGRRRGLMLRGGVAWWVCLVVIRRVLVVVTGSPRPRDVRGRGRVSMHGRVLHLLVVLVPIVLMVRVGGAVLRVVALPTILPVARVIVPGLVLVVTAMRREVVGGEMDPARWAWQGATLVRAVSNWRSRVVRILCITSAIVVMITGVLTVATVIPIIIVTSVATVIVVIATIIIVTW